MAGVSSVSSACLYVNTNKNLLSSSPSPGPDSAASGDSLAPSAIGCSPSCNSCVDPSAGPYSATPANNKCAREIIQRLTTQEDAEACFYVVDLRVLQHQMEQWRTLFPRVEPFYAVKCNSDPKILQALKQLDVSGFDCASRAEIEAVLGMGVPPQRVMFANPCKQLAHISFAREHGVEMMTFDNETELDKVKQLHPHAKLVLRIVTDDSKSICRFSQKFGASLAQVEPLLLAAKRLDLDVIGISFHVGSGCFDEFAFVDAVRRARKAFDVGAKVGYTFSLLDIGGGFPGSDNTKITFKQVTSVMAPEIEKLFPSSSVRVIAEPGRYFVTSAFTLLTCIHSIRGFQQKKKKCLPPLAAAAHGDDAHAAKSSDMFAALSSLNDGEAGAAATAAAAADAAEETEQAYMYYINDGIYGAFNCIFYDHAHAVPKVVTQQHKFVVNHEDAIVGPTFETAVYGPTCDGIDCIARGAQLPQLYVGDWLMFEEFGAYTAVAASNFNGMAKARLEFIELDA